MIVIMVNISQIENNFSNNLFTIKKTQDAMQK